MYLSKIKKSTDKSDVGEVGELHRLKLDVIRRKIVLRSQDTDPHSLLQVMHLS